MALILKYTIELRHRITGKEAVTSTGDVDQLTEDFLLLLKRHCPNSETYRALLRDHVLPYVEGAAEENG